MKKTTAYSETSQKQPDCRPGNSGRAYSWAVFYSFFLLALVLFIIMDAFVIPSAGIPVATEATVSDADWPVASLPTGSDIDKRPGDPGDPGNPGDPGDPVKPDDTESLTYQDENIRINIKKSRQYDTDIYVAEIYLSSIKYLRTAFASDTFGRNFRAKTSGMAADNEAILAINGDYYGARRQGFVLRNGLLYRDTARSEGNDDVLVINRDGSFRIANERKVPAESLKADGAWQILTFGPALIDNGEILEQVENGATHALHHNPRTALGQISPFHYVFIVADGRTKESRGLTLPQLAQILSELDCSVAYNLDGGGSATMWFRGRLVNKPSDGKTAKERNVSDIVYIGHK